MPTGTKDFLSASMPNLSSLEVAARDTIGFTGMHPAGRWTFAERFTSGLNGWGTHFVGASTATVDTTQSMRSTQSIKLACPAGSNQAALYKYLPIPDGSVWPNGAGICSIEMNFQCPRSGATGNAQAVIGVQAYLGKGVGQIQGWDMYLWHLPTNVDIIGSDALPLPSGSSPVTLINNLVLNTSGPISPQVWHNLKFQFSPSPIVYSGRSIVSPYITMFFDGIPVNMSGLYWVGNLVAQSFDGLGFGVLCELATNASPNAENMWVSEIVLTTNETG